MTLGSRALPTVTDASLLAHPPAAPHDPRDRELLTRADGWEIRALKSDWFGFFAARGLWHVQLWHPGKSLSILTPSTLTCGHYELGSAERAAPSRAASYEAIVDRI